MTMISDWGAEAESSMESKSLFHRLIASIWWEISLNKNILVKCNKTIGEYDKRNLGETWSCLANEKAQEQGKKSLGISSD